MDNTHEEEKFSPVRSELGLWTPDEVASAVGIKVETLAKWRAAGNGPVYTKLGKSVFYRMEDLKSWISHQRLGMNRREVE